MIFYFEININKFFFQICRHNVLVQDTSTLLENDILCLCHIKRRNFDTLTDNFFYCCICRVCHETQNSEYHEPCKNTSRAVDDRHQHSIPEGKEIIWSLSSLQKS